jgi:FeS assembly SUF system protein
MMIDEEYEQLKTRHILPVLNGEAELTDAYTLEDEGLFPDAPVDRERIREELVDALKSVYDPEIPLNIYDLGLVYELLVDVDANVHVKMTLTAPGCPVAGMLVQQVHDKLRSVAGVRRAKTELVWEPAWTKDRLTEAAKLELGLM